MYWRFLYCGLPLGGAVTSPILTLFVYLFSRAYCKKRHNVLKTTLFLQIKLDKYWITIQYSTFEGFVIDSRNVHSVFM